MAAGKVITDTGLAEMRKISCGLAPAFSQIAVGYGSSTPANDNTALDNEGARVTATVSVSGNNIIFEGFFTAGALNGDVYEIGIFNANNVMLCREVMPSPVKAWSQIANTFRTAVPLTRA